MTFLEFLIAVSLWCANIDENPTSPGARLKCQKTAVMCYLKKDNEYVVKCIKEATP